MSPTRSEKKSVSIALILGFLTLGIVEGIFFARSNSTFVRKNMATFLNFRLLYAIALMLSLLIVMFSGIWITPALQLLLQLTYFVGMAVAFRGDVPSFIAPVKFLSLGSSRWLGYLWVPLIFVAALFFTTFGVTSLKSIGTTNQPAILQGQRLIIPMYEKWTRKFSKQQFGRGEFIVSKAPKGSPLSTVKLPIIGLPKQRLIIKRIVAVGGDQVRLVKGTLWVNGNQIDEDFLGEKEKVSFPNICYFQGVLSTFETQMDRFQTEEIPGYLLPTSRMVVKPNSKFLAESQKKQMCETGTLKLAPDYYFVLGDDRSPAGSFDSRGFGVVPATQISGRAVWNVGTGMAQKGKKLIPPLAYSLENTR